MENQNDILQRVRLLMEYDMSMTLTENLVLINEQTYVEPEVLQRGGFTSPASSTSVADSRTRQLRSVSKTDVGYSGEVPVPSWWGDPHNMNMILAMASLVIPVAGPFISAGIMVGDAALYYSEGNEKDAGLSLLFAFLPGLSNVVNKIPAIRKLGVNGMTELFSKLKRGAKSISKLEKEALDGIKANEQLIKREYEIELKRKASEIIKTTSKSTDKSKLTNFISGAKTNILSGLQKFGKGVVKFGLTFAQIVALIKIYDKLYDKIRGDIPKNIVDKLIKSNIDPTINAWDFTKKTFGSSGSKEDNLLMVNAIKSGWKPGLLVPLKFQTQNYKTEILPQTKKEQDDYIQLLALARQQAGV